MKRVCFGLFISFSRFKAVSTVIFLLLISLFGHAQTKPDSNVHVYLLIGQSNMAGRGAVDAESKVIDPQIIMLDSQNHWVPATDPVHFDKPIAGVGPAISFAKQIKGNNKHVKIALVPCAWGGSPIKVWEPGEKYFAAHPYDDALARIKIAMQTGVLKGILWHQGESDNDSARATIYLSKLKALVNRLRTDLQMPELPFVAGEIGYFNKANFINNQINRLPTEVANTAVVSAKDLVDKGDQLHFNTASARELGKRYAVAMQQLQSNKTVHQPTTNKPAVVVLCFDDAEISHYTIVAPLLKKYHFDATFLVCEMPWKAKSDSQYYMNWQQIAALHKMGFEIGNHTGHHQNMTKLNRAEMKREIGYIDSMCKLYNIPKPISFAYPGNRSDSLSQVVLQEMGYRYARAGGSQYYDPQKDAKLVLPSYTMGSTEKLQERTWTALKNLQPGQILLFTIHGVPDIAHPDYTTSVEVFTQYLDYMKERGFKVVAMRDLEK
ncbi:MAG: polysaccharide deacetylase family protein [Chitinophagaceae bacterium]|nr:polysaccharide deacetylase family protein [Chitinophagaceae bacterium]